tara:strand:- start:469 stop:642 length:174 start_codon:yes stop_codon:yes gene_type:complete
MITVNKEVCDFCSACISVCPPDCITVKENDLIVDQDVCIKCDLCVKICPVEALKNES